jgi:hypothetical protein
MELYSSGFSRGTEPIEYRYTRGDLLGEIGSCDYASLKIL